MHEVFAEKTGRFPDGFPGGKKLVACFLKLVARILKSEPLIFSLMREGSDRLQIGFFYLVSEYFRVHVFFFTFEFPFARYMCRP